MRAQVVIAAVFHGRPAGHRQGGGDLAGLFAHDVIDMRTGLRDPHPAGGGQGDISSSMTVTRIFPSSPSLDWIRRFHGADKDAASLRGLRDANSIRQPAGGRIHFIVARDGQVKIAVTAISLMTSLCHAELSDATRPDCVSFVYGPRRPPNPH